MRKPSPTDHLPLADDFGDVTMPPEAAATVRAMVRRRFAGDVEAMLLDELGLTS